MRPTPPLIGREGPIERRPLPGDPTFPTTRQNRSLAVLAVSALTRNQASRDGEGPRRPPSGDRHPTPRGILPRGSPFRLVDQFQEGVESHLQVVLEPLILLLEHQLAIAEMQFLGPFLRPGENAQE